MLCYSEYATWLIKVQISSGITYGIVLNEELYAHRFQKLIYLHLSTELFHVDFSSIVRRNTDLSFF